MFEALFTANRKQINPEDPARINLTEFLLAVGFFQGLVLDRGRCWKFKVFQGPDNQAWALLILPPNLFRTYLGVVFLHFSSNIFGLPYHLLLRLCRPVLLVEHVAEQSARRAEGSAPCRHQQMLHSERRLERGHRREQSLSRRSPLAVIALCRRPTQVQHSLAFPTRLLLLVAAVPFGRRHSVRGQIRQGRRRGGQLVVPVGGGRLGRGRLLAVGEGGNSESCTTQ